MKEKNIRFNKLCNLWVIYLAINRLGVSQNRVFGLII